MPGQRICVFCSSSTQVDDLHRRTANELSNAIAWHGDTLVYGGANIGVMGVLGTSARMLNAYVIGVIPRSIVEWGLADPYANELIVTPDLHMRKRTMESLADAFIALPGGLGTAEELLEVITLKQLRVHHKPVVIINTAGFYDPLLALLERMVANSFAKPSIRLIYHVAATPEQAYHYLEAYRPPAIEAKWF